MFGTTRGVVTLAAAAVSGFLLWLASQADEASTGGYWTATGLVAVAGLTLALAQIAGGWTKWGWPRLAPGVFLVAFVPALVAGGIVLLRAQPGRERGRGIAADIGVDGLAGDLSRLAPAIALGLGLLLGLTFDTTGPRLPRGAAAEPAAPPQEPPAAPVRGPSGPGD